MRSPLVSLAFVVTLGGLLPAGQTLERLDYSAISKIRDEGLNRSQVMDHISWLSDVYGPRLTGGPGIQQSGEWVLRKFHEWGLSEPHREMWPFGKGWSLQRFSAHLVEPQVQPLIGVVAPWSASTRGASHAEVVSVRIEAEADFAEYRGALSGKIVLTQPERSVPMLHGNLVHRMAPDDLNEASTTPIPKPRVPETGAAKFQERVRQFFRDEGVLATFNRGSDTVMGPLGSDLSGQQQKVDGGTIFANGQGSRGPDAGQGVPEVTLAVEHYNRMMRILAKKLPVRVELDIQTTFHDEVSANGFNVIADIPGTDPLLKNEVVILGAHLDSVAAATGATDNATGVAAMMEAMRILKVVGAQPRRTIRVALWGGEEQGLLGSRAYVKQHYADRATMAMKADHAHVAAYFNSDNGTGRVRGIWLQGNVAVRPIFEEWMKPLSDLGVSTVGPRSVGSTDHVSFDEVGLPGFQFMVDRLEYNSRTHHSNMDFVDRVQRDDMIQHATVVAVFAYNAAMRDAKLPRKDLALVPSR